MPYFEVSSSGKGITVRKAGTYLVSVSMYMVNGFTSGDIIHLTFNGATHETLFRIANDAPYTTMRHIEIVNFNANDEIYPTGRNQGGARGEIASYIDALIHIG